VHARSPRETRSKPYLQMVILFATDNRVANYAKKIQNTFLEAGTRTLQ
jgi:hypothetical protein